MLVFVNHLVDVDESSPSSKNFQLWYLIVNKQISVMLLGLNIVGTFAAADYKQPSLKSSSMSINLVVIPVLVGLTGWVDWLASAAQAINLDWLG